MRGAGAGGDAVLGAGLAQRVREGLNQLRGGQPPDELPDTLRRGFGGAVDQPVAVPLGDDIEQAAPGGSSATPGTSPAA